MKQNQEGDDERSYPSTLSDDFGGKSSEDGMQGNNKKRAFRGNDVNLAISEVDDKFCVGIDDKKNRGNYRCGRCNLPKKGHVCPFQPVLKPRDRTQIDQLVMDAEVQAEIDADMTVANLGDLNKQGFPESYLQVFPKIRRVSTLPT